MTIFQILVQILHIQFTVNCDYRIENAINLVFELKFMSDRFKELCISTFLLLRQMLKREKNLQIIGLAHKYFI